MSGTRLETIEGVRTLVVDRPAVLPPSLDRLLASLSNVTFRADIRPRGASIRCEAEREHRFARLREGTHVGLDGRVRDLSVLMCEDCACVQVRDVSIDRLPGLRTGGQPLRRRSEVIGWYTGKRRAGREYR